MCLTDRYRIISDMREWLSWWSTTLPRSGPRVRVPSRALVSDIQIYKFSYVREWLSWWSTTLPRSGSRVRVPSRALFHQKGHHSDVFFLINRVLPDSNFRVSSLPLRSAHSGHPPDVLRRVALATLFHSAAVRSCPEGFLIHRM